MCVLCVLQKQVLDDRIEGVVFRVEEFKSQLEHVQHNMVSNAEKVDDLHSYSQQLKDLYTRVDHVEVFTTSLGTYTNPKVCINDSMTLILHVLYTEHPCIGYLPHSFAMVYVLYLFVFSGICEYGSSKCGFIGGSSGKGRERSRPKQAKESLLISPKTSKNAPETCVLWSSIIIIIMNVCFTG